MKISYPLAFLLTILFGPLGFFYVGPFTSILFFITMGVVWFNRQDIIGWVSTHIDGALLAKTDPIHRFVEDVIVKNIPALKGYETIITYELVLWIAFSWIFLILVPFYVSRHNRVMERNWYDSLQFAISSIENKIVEKLKPKIPQKLQGGCQKCGKVISVKDKTCPNCGSSKPFDDKKKILEYAKNNFEAVYLTKIELRTIYDISLIFKPVVEFFTWLLDVLDKMFHKDGRMVVAQQIKDIWGKFSLFFKTYKKEIASIATKGAVFVVLALLIITGISAVVHSLFHTDDIWIVWYIIGDILVFILIVVLGGLGAVPLFVFEDLKEKRNYFREKDSDFFRANLIRFANVFREKYRDFNELEKLVEYYRQRNEFISKIYKKFRISDSLNVFLLLLVVDFVVFFTLFLTSVKNKAIFVMLIALALMIVIAKSIKLVYYASQGYKTDVYEFKNGKDGYWANDIFGFLDYKEEL